MEENVIAIIGGADGPTSIFVAGANALEIIAVIVIVTAAVILGVKIARKKK